MSEAAGPAEEGGLLDRALPFGLTLVLVVSCAMAGGSYDSVVREQQGLIVWWVLALGYGFGLLPRARLRPILAALPLALVLLGLWTFLGLAWTQSDERTLAEVTRVAGFLGLVLLVLSTVSRRNWRSVVAGLAAGSLAVAAVAVASRIAPSAFPRDFVRDLSGVRLNYPFNYWNAVGAWGAMAVVGGLAWSVAARSVTARAAYLALVPVAGLAIYLSYSRAAIGGLVVGVVCLLALSRHRLMLTAHTLAAAGVGGAAILVVRGVPAVARGEAQSDAGGPLLTLAVGAALCALVAVGTWRVGADRRWRLPETIGRPAVAVVVVALLVAAAVVVPTAGQDAWSSFREQRQETASNDPAQRLGSLHGSRYGLWSTALETFESRPALGTGAGTYEFTWSRNGRSSEFVRDAHSLYLEALTELGFPGLLLVLGAAGAGLAVTVASLKRARHSDSHAVVLATLAVLAVFLVQAGLDWMWESTAVAALALAGVSAASVRLTVRDGPPRVSVPVRVVTTVACLVMCLLFVPGLGSTSSLRDSKESVRAGNLPRAGDQADDAVAAAPWAFSPRLQRGLVSQAAGDLAAAEADFLSAAEREPQNWRAPLLAARVQAQRGQTRAALASIRRARRLRPRALKFIPLPFVRNVESQGP